MRIRFALLLTLLSSCATSPAFAPRSDLIVCGADEVFILDVRGEVRKIWSWRAAEHPEIPEGLRKKFGSTDECKPVDGGRKILVTSSGGAVALVDRATGQAVFTAAAVNAHSAEILPGNRVVVASSTGEGGNRLLLFDLAVSDKPLSFDELQGAHGVVWDAERKLLWALGTDELRAYEVLPGADGSRALARRLSYTPPNSGGHDLRSVPGSPYLNLTTTNHVWQFDRDLLTFRTHPELGNLAGVKCVDVDPDGGATVYIQAEISWWAEHLRFLGSDRTVDFPKQKLYKARWMPRPD